MIFTCFYFKKQIPFKDVYVHALIKDSKGQKMSKSKGNIIDPKDMIEKYGTDALRFALIIQLSPGRDIRMSESKINDAKHFITKIWNAARFIKMQGKFDHDFDYKTVRHDINKWAINSVVKLYNNCINCIDNYNFNIC